MNHLKTIPSRRQLLTRALLLALAFFFTPFLLLAQEDDTRFTAVDVRGKASIYRDQTDETSRLQKGQKVDDGDRITTGENCEVVLRLKGRAYLHISQNSRVKITRLGFNDSHVLQIRVNLSGGRMLAQLDRPSSSFEVTVGEVRFRAHGTLMEVSKKKGIVFLTAYEGGVVATSRGHVEMAKSRQVMKFDQDRFRFKHYLKMEEETRLEEWKNHLAEIRGKQPTGKR